MPVRLASLMRLCLIAAALALAGCAQTFDLQGHRGTRGLMPENTLAAFEHALQIGVSTLELDIAITADGTPVISHDPALTPAITRDATGQWIKSRGPLIKSLTLAELHRYDVGRSDPESAYGRQFPRQQARDGQRIPTLASLFQLVNEIGADKVRFDIETKVFPNAPDETLSPEAFVDRLLPVIRQFGMTRRAMIQSFDWRTLRLVQQLEPAIETVYLSAQTPNTDTLRDGSWTAGMLRKDHASVAHMVKASGGRTWAPLFTNLDEAAIQTAHTLGIKVIPWTVNEAADMDRLIAWGVDGIISDYPDRVREAMARAGLALPPAVKR